MCGCGRETHEASATPTTSVDGTDRFTRERQVSRPEVPVVYTGRRAMLLKGPVSRRVYALRPAMAPLMIDARDQPSFLASPLFGPA